MAEAVAAGGVALAGLLHPAVPARGGRLDGGDQGGDWHGGDGAWLGTALEPGSPFAGSPWRQRKGALWDLGPHLLALTVPTPARSSGWPPAPASATPSTWSSATTAAPPAP